MALIIKSSKMAEVKAALATLEIGKTYSIQEIVDTIRQVCNHKSKSSSCFVMKSGNYDGPGTMLLKDLYVDMTYQRRIRLAKIINKLIKEGGFDKNIAGSIDIAYRPCTEKYYVWDGLRRCLMVGICGGNCIVGAIFRHADNLYEADCIKQEAKFFKVRNADKEAMSFEEVFKARVGYEEDLAMVQLSLLKKCNFDVESLNPAGKTLGGLKSFDEIHGVIDNDTIIEASKLYLYAWPKETQVSGYAFCGLATLINNDKFYDIYTIEDVKEMLRDYAKHNLPRTLTKDRLNNAAFKSIAYNFVNNVLAVDTDDKDLTTLLNSLLSKEQQGMMEVN